MLTIEKINENSLSRIIGAHLVHSHIFISPLVDTVHDDGLNPRVIETLCPIIEKQEPFVGSSAFEGF